MFIAAVAIAIIFGYIFKGKLSNIDTSKIKAVYLVFIAFSIEVAINFSMRGGYISRGALTFVLDLVMYILLFIFVYLNNSNKWILLMGIGFLLNAFVIFLNGGAMPVSPTALSAMGVTRDISTQGLYRLLDSSTKLPFLADIIYLKYPRGYAISIGDIVEVVAVVLLIFTGMKSKEKGTVNI